MYNILYIYVYCITMYTFYWSFFSSIYKVGTPLQLYRLYSLFHFLTLTTPRYNVKCKIYPMT